ncbi:DUF2786 domain-containing protein [Mycobacterium hubeiense]|uniref:DUF2786 domain-containing protein n=1 Tax=Mycobacterium hubeiense TaxID=1867256 RepID=UPI000C7EF02D|nr:DUF2786 domain-containing protein [Mycobacterium sp. QGD 101]
MSTDKAITRIGALLLKAEGTDNPHEADAYIVKAQTLATLNSIDLATARARAADRARQTTPQQKAITIGVAGRRGLRTFVDLFLVIARANDVQIDIARNFTEVYAFGYPEDIAVTEALYTRLVTHMVAACEVYLATGDYKHETVERAQPPHHDRRRETPSVSKISARLEFHAGFTARIKARLAAGRRAARATAAATPHQTGPGSEIVLAGKRLEVQDYYTLHSRARGRRYRGHRPSIRSQRGRAAGDLAGQAAQLSAATELGGSASAVTPRRVAGS